MVVVALVGRVGTVLDAHAGTYHGAVVGVPDREVAGGEIHQIALFEVDELVGHGPQSQRVGSDEVLADADADDQRAPGAGGDQPARLVPGHHPKCVGAVQAFHRVGDSVEQVARLVQAAVDQVRDEFRIGVGLEFEAGIEQFVAQFLVVLDDAVVDQADAPARHVRMGVLDRRGHRG